MKLNGIDIDDTFAEAFDMSATRIIVTALNDTWVMHAARSVTGFATSVIGCGVEAGIERTLAPTQTPDGRPGVAILLFAMSRDALAKHVEKRVGQCILTTPSSAVFSGLDGEPIDLGRNIRYFGDGFQISKLIGERRFWRIPVMDGEFICEETTGRVKAVGGGNFLILSTSLEQALSASEAAITAMSKLSNVIMPFPGGIVRSGSKVGSKYPKLMASTNDAFCPTLRGITKSQLSDEIRAVLEIVVNGLTAPDIARAMRTGIDAICALGADAGVKRISAGNYGGKLGPHHFHLREIMA